MPVQKIARDVYCIPLGFVNVFLINRDELTLIDAGIKGSEIKIFQAISELGLQKEDLRHILITHIHMDHIGSLPELKKGCPEAKVYMHSLDAAAYAGGSSMRTVEPAPGWLNSLVVKLFINGRKPSSSPPAVPVDTLLNGEEEIPGTGGLRAVHTPGHTCGHLAYFLPTDGGIFFIGDAASHMFRLGFSFLYEDFLEGKETLMKMSQNRFETVCFSHGSAILQRASQIFSEKFNS
jgi:glyoxylase-like metal-dependent hydrolase (beta-lactamase superfamily II)